MTSIKNPQINADVTMKSLAYSGFPGSSLVALHRELTDPETITEDSKPYRALFDEMVQQGQVPHDRSIIGPAAYFTDLFRMVTKLERKETAKNRRLIERRADLASIPLNEDSTNTTKPYLHFVNKILHATLARIGKEFDENNARPPDQMFVPHDDAIKRTKLYVEQAGVDYEDIVAIFAKDETDLAAARLGITRAMVEDSLGMGSEIDLDASANTFIKREKLELGLEGTAFPGYLRALGVRDDVIELVLGPYAASSAPAVWLEGVPLGSRFESPLFFANHEIAGDDREARRWFLMQHDHDGKAAAAFGDFSESNLSDLDEMTAYQLAISQIIRFSRLVEAFGIPAKDFSDLGQAGTQLGFTTLDFVQATGVQKFAKRFDLTIAESNWIFGECNAFPMTLTDGTPSLFAKTFPLPEGQDEHSPFTADTVSPDHAAGANLSLPEARQVLHMISNYWSDCRFTDGISVFSDQDPLSGEFPDPNGLLTFMYRVGRLKTLLDRPVADILWVAKSLSANLSGYGGISLVVRYLDWAKDAKIAIESLRAMVQPSDTPTCRMSDLKAVSAAAREAIKKARPSNGGAETSQSENDTKPVIHAALAAYYNVAPELIAGILDIGIPSVQAQQLFDALEADEFGTFYDNGEVPATESVLAFCEFQAVLAVAKTLGLPASVFSAGGGVDNVGDWGTGSKELRSLPNIRILQLAQARSDALGIDFLKASADYTENRAGNEQVNRASTILGLSAQQTKAVNDETGGDKFFPLENLTTTVQPNTVELATAFANGAHLAEHLGVDFSSLYRIAELATTRYSTRREDIARDLNDDQTDDDGVTREQARRQSLRADIADAARAAVMSQTPDSQWAEVVEKTEAALLEAERDRLVRKILWIFADPGCYTNLWLTNRPNCADDISEIVLVDVLMGGTAKISELKLGLNSIQRYIQRTLMGKEGQPQPFQLDKTQWTWRSHYRLWETNRKVFLFPENFLDPGLRRQKTPLFEKLEESLLQGQIDEDRVSEVYLEYLDQLENLSHLEIVSAAPAVVPVDDTANAGALQRTLFFLGRTEGPKPDYYLRSAVFGKKMELLIWRPWEKINFPLHSRQVTCAYVNNRVHLYWLDQRTVSDQHEGTRVSRSYVTMRYTHQLHAGGWSPARTVPDAESAFWGAITIGPGGNSAAIDPRMKDKEFSLPSAANEQVRLKITGKEPYVRGLELPPDGTTPADGLEIEAKLVSLFDATQVKLNEAEPSKSLTNGPTWPDSYSLTSDIRVSDSFNMLLAQSGETIEHYHIAAFNGKDSANPGFFAAARTAGGSARNLYFYEERGSGVWIVQDPDGFHSLDVVNMSCARNSLIVVLNSFKGDKPTLSICDIGEGKAPAKLQHPSLPSQDGLTNIREIAISDDGNWISAIVSGSCTEEMWGAENIPVGDLFQQMLVTSTDRGQTWTVLYPNYIKTIAYDRSGVLVALMDDGLTLVFDDIGIPTTYRENGIPDGTVPHDLVIGADGVSYVGGLGGELYYSVDLGKTWNTVSGLNDFTETAPLGFTNFGLLLSAKTDNDASEFYLLNDMALLALREVSDTFTAEGNPRAVCFNEVTNQFAIGTWGSGMAMSVRGRGAYCNIESSAPNSQKLEVTAYRGETVSGEYPMATMAVHELGQRLLTSGLDSMLSLASQTAKIELGQGGSIDAQIDFRPSSPWSVYYREVFFHIPFLIAETLNREKKFEDAQNWYHHVFRPMHLGSDTDPNDPTPFWRYAPFKSYELKHLQAFDPEEFTIYDEDPFDAHAIAAIRMGAYEKAVVMRYIDNLLDWGDQLFESGSWEDITQAMMHYRTASDLLGPDPRKALVAATLPATKTFSGIRGEGFQADAAPEDTFHLEDRKFFPIPANSAFSDYWTRTADRISKIRASEDVHGVHRQLALFQPPIDPRKIMAALASGQSLSDAIESAKQGAPRYRFNAMLSRARSAAQSAASLGSNLLSTLEKKDAEGLALLRSKHERGVLDRITKSKELAIEQAQDKLTALANRSAAARKKHAHFSKLIDQGLLGPEKLAMKLKNDALILSETTAAIRSASAAGYAAPCIFGLSNGGQDIGKVIESAASAIDSASGAIGQSSGLAEVRGSNDRRSADWDWQLKQADDEVARIKDEVSAAKLALKRANLDQDLHQHAIENAESIANYVDGKFSNRALYGWLADRLSSLVSQSYQLALELAMDAQWAYQWERCVSGGPITARPVNSRNDSLMAGDELLLGLNQLEKLYLDSGLRELEIERTFSLAGIDSDLKDKIRSGAVPFSLKEGMFAGDGVDEGHRRIRSVAVTIPAIVGPYQSVNAVLTQTRNKVLSDGHASYSMTQSRVAISRGVSDHGVFDLDFKGETYQPFEGTGAVSDWLLSFPEEMDEDIRNSISDIVIQLRYTCFQN